MANLQTSHRLPGYGQTRVARRPACRRRPGTGSSCRTAGPTRTDPRSAFGTTTGRVNRHE